MSKAIYADTVRSEWGLACPKCGSDARIEVELLCWASLSVDGTDTHHYQFGVGASVQLVKTLSLFVEGVPLGERAVSAGVGLAL